MDDQKKRRDDLDAELAVILSKIDLILLEASGSDRQRWPIVAAVANDVRNRIISMIAPEDA